MKLYNFKRLIRRYSVTFYLVQPKGAYIGGKWEKTGESFERMRGAIVPMNKRKVYSDGGSYSTQDRELYITSPLPSPLQSLQVLYRDNLYSVEEGRSYDEYADVAVYTLRWVSAADPTFVAKAILGKALLGIATV